MGIEEKKGKRRGRKLGEDTTLIDTCILHILFLLYVVPQWLSQGPEKLVCFHTALRAALGEAPPPVSPRVPSPAPPSLLPTVALRVASSTRRGCRGEGGRLQVCPGGTAATSQPVIAKQTRLKYWIGLNRDKIYAFAANLFVQLYLKALDWGNVENSGEGFPNETSGGKRRPSPGAQGAGVGARDALNPFLPASSGKSSEPSGGSWGSIPPGSGALPRPARQRIGLLSGGNREGGGDQNENLTRMEGAAQQPTQGLQGQWPKSGEAALAAPLAPQHPWALAAARPLTLRSPASCEGWGPWIPRAARFCAAWAPRPGGALRCSPAHRGGAGSSGGWKERQES